MEGMEEELVAYMIGRLIGECHSECLLIIGE